jgi:hypothetical protein
MKDCQLQRDFEISESKLEGQLRLGVEILAFRLVSLHRHVAAA